MEWWNNYSFFRKFCYLCCPFYKLIMKRRLSLFITLTFALVASAQTTLTIPQIQGSGSSSSYVSQQIKTTGIVTAKFIGTGKINGYFLQDAIGDGNAATSDGIFVYTTVDNVVVGDKIQVTATVSESSTRSQLGAVSATTKISSNNTLPVTKVQYNASTFNWEQYEGMLVEFDQVLYVTANSNLQASGQLSLNPIRKFNATNQCFPGSSEYSNMIAQNAKAQILLDDGITTSSYTPIVFADANGTRRTGERVKGLRAVVDYASSNYVVYPATAPIFYGNPRPTTLTQLGNYNLKVCSFNLEYYLTTNYGQGYGANNVTEAAKQHTKIVAALLAIDADIYGLIEIEQGQDALIKLVNALNSATVAGRYSYINDGGTIYGTYTKVGYIYRTDKVSPYLSLQSNNSPLPLNRKKAQAFTLKSNNQKFIFCLNHYKAKSGCSSATGADVDKGDGQSCYNATRVAESTSNLSFLTTCKTYYGDNDVLLMGDLNAYAKEDPITTLISNGFADMHRAFYADSAYSYMYNGEAGYLDHALATASLQSQITGVQVFHINSDEPAMFEYGGSAYQANMYRCSDHDPVVVGLNLGGVVNSNTNISIQNQEVYPTEVYNEFVVKNAENTVLEVYSLNGKMLIQQKVSDNQQQISLQGIVQKGIYVVKIYSDEMTRFVKIIKL